MKGIKICYVAAHCSSAHGVIITAEGKVMTFGRNEKGQLGTGDTENRNVPVMLDSIKDLTVVAAAVGRNHSLFLTDRGSVFSCGDNKSGQCGVGNTTSIIHTPCRISFKESKVVKVFILGLLFKVFVSIEILVSYFFLFIECYIYIPILTIF